MTGAREEAALVSSLRGDGGGRCRLRGATSEGEEVNAAGCGGPYDSATTNGLPPNLALILGRAATASALLAYSPNRTL